MNKWICSCGKENINNFCAACGAKRPTSSSSGWSCACGSVNDDQASFCKSCGRRRGDVGFQFGPQPAGQQPAASGVTSTVIVAVFIGLIAAVVGMFVYFNTSDTAKLPASNNTQTQQSASTADNTLTEVSLGGINIGDRRSKVIEKYGQPFKISQEGKYERHYYSVMEVVYNGDFVSALISSSSSVSTNRGFHDGTSVADIRASYGEPDMLSSYEGLDLYEYNRKSPLGPAILRYAIRQNGGVVDYISIRTVD